MVEKRNIEIYRGDSKTITVNFSLAASMLLAGHVWLTIKNKKDAVPCTEEPNECVFQTSDEIQAVYAADQVTITGYRAAIYIPPAITRTLNIFSYAYDIQAVGPDFDPSNPTVPAIVKTLTEGKFKVLEDVTVRTT